MLLWESINELFTYYAVVNWSGDVSVDADALALHLEAEIVQLLIHNTCVLVVQNAFVKGCCLIVDWIVYIKWMCGYVYEILHQHLLAI